LVQYKILSAELRIRLFPLEEAPVEVLLQ
jgi:hypothetical protein